MLLMVDTQETDSMLPLHVWKVTSSAGQAKPESGTCYCQHVCADHLITIPRGNKEDVIMCVRELDAVRRSRLTDSLWVDEACGHEIEASIQMLLAARSHTDQ